MISKKDFKRFSEQYDAAFEDVKTAMESILGKPIVMPLGYLIDEETDDKVKCIVVDYELDGHIVEIEFVNKYNDYHLDTRYVGIDEIAEKGEW